MTSSNAKPLLATKLFPPPALPGYVTRHRLIERLDQGLNGKLTLLLAPAGFGKSSLVSHWLRESVLPFTWLSLDARDNDPARFWSYVIEALNIVEPQIGYIAMRPGVSQPFYPEEVATSLINELVNRYGEENRAAVLVLDDYHVIENETVHENVNFLLDHLPKALHLVIISRFEPPFALGKRRLRWEATEIRAHDLCFTEAEAALFFDQTMKIEVAVEEVEELITQTEGWIASLQLAGLSFQDGVGGSNALHKSAGMNRLIEDYFIDEILARQEEEVQAFLQQTSILESFCSGLCEAVVYGEEQAGEEGPRSHDMLRRLEGLHLFLIPLDEDRKWYRYHHLFRELLQRRPSVEPASTLHLRAGRWYASRGSEEALPHYVAAGALDLAARFVEKFGSECLWEKGEVYTLQLWLDSLQENQIQASLHLCLLKAWLLFFQSKFDQAAQLLMLAQVHADQGQDDTSLEGRLLRGELLALGMFISVRQGDSQESRKELAGVLDNIPEQAMRLRALLSHGLAQSYFYASDFTNGLAMGQETFKLANEIGYYSLALYALGYIGDVYKLRADLSAYALAANHFMEYARDMVSQMNKWGHYHLAILAHERNEIEEALHLANQMLDQAQRTANHWMEVEANSLLALAMHAKGDIDSAFNAAKRAIQLKEQHNLQLDQVMASLSPENRLVHYALIKGDTEMARGWVESKGLRASDAPTFRNELDYISLARVLIAEDQMDEAIDLLERIRNDAEAAHRRERVMKVQVLQAIAFHAREDIDAALAKLEEVLALAEPQGYLRLFLDEGKAMARLLYEARKAGMHPAYTSRLLAAFPESVLSQEAQVQAELKEQGVEPLSGRELEILTVLAAGLTNQEIADQLFISIHTVKVHVRNILTKLNAPSRTKAIAKARGLGII